MYKIPVTIRTVAYAEEMPTKEELKLLKNQIIGVLTMVEMEGSVSVGKPVEEE